MVDVYDGAYAEAHVGMIKFQVDIVKCYVCFKGRIAYDLNVLKVLRITVFLSENGLSLVVNYLSACLFQKVTY